MSNNLYLNGNGFGTYLSTGFYSGNNIPQSRIWDEYAKMYRYYLIEHIHFEFIPARIQWMQTSVALTDDIWQFPTVMNTFPEFQNFLPANTLVSVTDNIRYLCARKKATIARGYSCCSRGIDLENNLLTRQSAPMLRTNASSASRELYEANMLTTLTAVVS